MYLAISTNMDYFYIDMAIITINVALHLNGLFLLICTYKGREKTTQHLHLISLSSAELLRQIASLTVYAIMTHGFSVGIDVVPYIAFITRTPLYYLYFFSMIQITADRLAASLLNVRYKVVCTLYKTKILIVCTWFFCILICLPMITSLYFVYGWHWRRKDWNKDNPCKTLYVYIPSILNVSYFLFAIITYVIMFKKFVRSRRSVSTISINSSGFQLFQTSKFYISVLIITSFLLLAVIPNILTSICTYFEIEYTTGVFVYVSISESLSDTADGVIYVFMYKPVRAILTKKTNSIAMWCAQRFHQTFRPGADGRININICWCNNSMTYRRLRNIMVYLQIFEN